MNGFSEVGTFLWFWGALFVVIFLFLHFLRKFIFDLYEVG